MREILIGPLRKKVVLKINLKVRLNIFYMKSFLGAFNEYVNLS